MFRNSYIFVNINQKDIEYIIIKDISVISYFTNLVIFLQINSILIYTKNMLYLLKCL